MRFPRSCAAGLLWVVPAVMARGQGVRLEDSVAQSMRQFFWALVAFVVVSCVGLLWAGFVRQRARNRAGEGRDRESALEAYYADLFENSHDVVFTLDLEGRLLSLNKAGEAKLTVNREALVRRPLADRCDAAGAENLGRMLERLCQGETVVHGEVRCRTAQGDSVVLDTTLRLQHRAGVPVLIQGMAWDITERVVAEDSLRRSERQLRASLEERERLGRDLHDGIIQSLYAIGLGLQECRALLHESPVKAGERLGLAVNQLNQVIREVRGFIGGLAADPVDAAAFERLLRGVLDSAGARATAAFRLDIDPAAVRALGSPRARGVLQIAREALSNSLRHAGATRQGSVRLALESAAVVLEVRDDGAGFETATAAGVGRGLGNMEARAAELGGVLEIRASTGTGTCVRLALPHAHGSDPQN